MNQIAKTDQKAPALAPMIEQTGILGMIERASRDPNVDVTKMRELLAMRKEVMSEEAEHAFNDAMTKAQGDMRRVAADSSNSQTRSRYASYAALDKAMRPIYTQHGFALSFGTEEGGPPDYVRVTCHVSNSGYTRKYQVDMPADGKGAKGGDVMTKTHAVGSAMSYGQRYLLKMIFNIAIGDDDDGNAAGAGEKIEQKQVEELDALIAEVGADKARFCKHFNIPSLAGLPLHRLPEATALLVAKRAK